MQSENLKFVIFIFSIYFLVFSLDDAFSEEQTVLIPFGAFDPSFDTPVDNWYDPPVITTQKRRYCNMAQ